MPVLLLVDDDAGFRQLLSVALRDGGYEVVDAAHAEQALWELARGQVDALLVDVRLPGMSGLDLMREVARRGPTPMIVVSAQDQTEDVVAGLEAGADDYITKPVALEELEARLRAVLRRATAPPLELATASLRFHPSEPSVFRHGVEVPLTATEHAFMAVLASSPGAMFTREELLERVWQRDALADVRMVDALVARLRRKLEDDPASPRHLRTARGFGYRLIL